MKTFKSSILGIVLLSITAFAGVVKFGGVDPELCTYGSRVVSFLEQYVTIPEAFAQAASGGCRCNGVVYDGASQCCINKKLVMPIEMPSGDLDIYKGSMIQRPDYTPIVTNPVCGAEGGVAGLDNPYGVPFHTCCGKHDLAWQMCNGSRIKSDADLESCLKARCKAIKHASAVQRKLDMIDCNTIVVLYMAGIRSPFGQANYATSIQAACIGCKPDYFNCVPERWRDLPEGVRPGDVRNWFCSATGGCDGVGSGVPSGFDTTPPITCAPGDDFCA